MRGLNRLRMLLAEDHPLMREAIGKIVEAEYEVIGFAERGDQVEAIARYMQPDIVLLDVSLPGLSGIRALPALRAALPETCIVMLTTHSDPVYQEEAFRRGANGYVLKRCAYTDLLPAISDGLSSLVGARKRQA